MCEVHKPEKLRDEEDAELLEKLERANKIVSEFFGNHPGLCSLEQRAILTVGVLAKMK